ncbi:MAG: FmdB family transcriptional regulator [Candidatus Dormibacteraeota bacterium]|nr:FmdB family transcriptional regulator [Candidatus Dormibacteraeota bacterium]
MPIYGYRCQSCQREFEVQQRMSDPAQAACADCGGPGTRLFYPAGILFKGSGFYKTDSRSTAAAGSTGTKADGAGEPAKADGAGEATKPATPAKDKPAVAAPSKAPESTKPASTATD